MSSIQICTQTSDFANIQSAQNYFGGQLTNQSGPFYNKSPSPPPPSKIAVGGRLCPDAAAATHGGA